jgi:hypothetical protein
VAQGRTLPTCQYRGHPPPLLVRAGQPTA